MEGEIIRVSPLKVINTLLRLCKKNINKIFSFFCPPEKDVEIVKENFTEVDLVKFSLLQLSLASGEKEKQLQKNPDNKTDNHHFFVPFT